MSACISSSASIPQETRDTFTDQRGRTCVYVCADSCKSECDAAVTSTACAASTKPCLSVVTLSHELHPEQGDTDLLAICGSCCDANDQPVGSVVDCSPVTCTTNQSCVFDEFNCSGGTCTCRGKVCSQ